MDNIFLSIIIPAFNSEKYIGKCLESIINQNYNNYEVIIVNDGSTDNTEKICKNIIKDNNKFKIINKINGGVSSARNEALKISTGKYIWFIDSDDYIEKDALKIIYEKIDDVDVLAFGYEQIYKTKQTYKFKERKIDQDKAIKYMFLNKIFIGALWNKVIKREIIEQIRFDERISFGEDLLFQYYTLKSSKKIKIINNILYHYVIRDGGICKSSDIDKKIQGIYVTDIILKENFDDRKIKKYAIIKYVNINILVLMQYKEYKKNNEYYNKLSKNLKKYIKDYIFSKDYIINKIKNLLKLIYIFLI